MESTFNQKCHFATFQDIMIRNSDCWPVTGLEVGNLRLRRIPGIKAPAGLKCGTLLCNTDQYFTDTGCTTFLRSWLGCTHNCVWKGNCPAPLQMGQVTGQQRKSSLNFSTVNTRGTYLCLHGNSEPSCPLWSSSVRNSIPESRPESMHTATHANKPCHLGNPNTRTPAA